MISRQFFCFAIIAVSVFSTVVFVRAQGVLLTDAEVQVRVGNVDQMVFVAGSHMQYGNGADCGDTGHKTSEGRFFDHIHHALVAVVLNQYGVLHSTVTITNINTYIKAYWDKRVGFPSNGGETITCNCWGHAFGFTTWIQDPTYIYQDNYTVAFSPKAGDVIKQSGHAAKIVSAYTDEKPLIVTIVTSEKFRDSGIYEIEYKYNPLLPPTKWQNFYRPK